jgi:transposase
MRGRNESQVTMLSLITPDQRVPKDHPLRRVKALADAALAALSSTFDEMYSKVGRPSIPPERLLKATLLMAFYSVRSERLFCEQLDYNLLFRWFLDMDGVEESFDHSTFSRNRQRLLEHEVAAKFLAEVVSMARGAALMSDEHFTVDGTLIEAWASLKSFRPKGEKPEDRPPPDDPGNPTVNFHGEKRSNETHQSTTDPEAKLARKGNNQPAKLSYLANALMENRNGLLVDLRVEPATGYGERVGALAMLDGGPRWMAERFGTPATRSVSASGSESKRSSAGRRPSRASGRPDSEGRPARSSPLTSSLPPTTCSGSPS